MEWSIFFKTLFFEIHNAIRKLYKFIDKDYNPVSLWFNELTIVFEEYLTGTIMNNKMNRWKKKRAVALAAGIQKLIKDKIKTALRTDSLSEYRLEVTKYQEVSDRFE